MTVYLAVSSIHGTRCGKKESEKRGINLITSRNIIVALLLFAQIYAFCIKTLRNLNIFKSGCRDC